MIAMSSGSTAPRSIFAKPPIKIIVGSEDHVYYVHHGVLEAHPEFDARLKEASDQYEHAIDWSMFDEKTIECVLGYLYTGGYQAPPESSEAENEDATNAEEEGLAEEGEEDGIEAPDEVDEEAEEESPIPDTPLSKALSECDLNERPLTPLDQCGGVNLAAEKNPLSKSASLETQDQDQDPEPVVKGNTAAEIYLHAKVYSFASQLDFSKLEQFALNRLAEVLVVLEPTSQILFPYLADAIRLVYEKTTAADDARNLLSQFVALKYTTLVGEELDTLVTEGGEFMIDLSHKLARKLTALSIGLEEKLDDHVRKNVTLTRRNENLVRGNEHLVRRNEELEGENTEQGKELEALKEQVQRWEAQFPSYAYQISRSYT